MRAGSTAGRSTSLSHRPGRASSRGPLCGRGLLAHPRRRRPNTRRTGGGSGGQPPAGRWRTFRYEVRCWPDGIIADANEAVASPQLLTNDPAVAGHVLDLVGALPSPVWGRDELRTGEMWNSNSVIAWLLANSGLPIDPIRPPAGGRAPGWQAGLAVAHRSPMASPHPRANQTEGQDAHTTAVGAGARLLQPPELKGPGCLPGPSSCR